MIKHFDENDVRPSIDDIVKQRAASIDAALFYHSTKNVDFNDIFTGKSTTDVEQEKKSIIEELNLSYSLTLLAAIEATLRVDVQKRIQSKLRDNLSKEFIKLGKTHKTLKLSEHIICCRETYDTNLKHLYSDLKAAIKYRHWLAHGRYWKFKSKKLDFDSIMATYQQIETQSSAQNKFK
jgi:hypothetical protein